jgi:hypothetical protein
VFRTVLVALLPLCGCARNSLTSFTRGYDSRVNVGVTRLRTATAPFHSLDAAVAAGYPRELPDCLIHEQHGAMGYHHVNRALVDAKLEIEHPEILLYERRPDGAYRLNGVEFIVPFRTWPRDSVPPVLMGQTLHREDNLKIWYLHVWAWTKNPEGLFANFNPDVTCPDGAGKVYKPFEAP